MAKRKKRSPFGGAQGRLWRGRFLRALARLGNVRAAAEAAGIDHGTAYDHRKRDAGFAAKWEEALAKSQEAPPPPCRRSPSPAKAGEDFVVRRSKRHGVQVVRAGLGRWSSKAEAVFLVHLRATGCLRRAAAAAGFSANTVGYRRKRYPAFRADCDAAMEEATAQLGSLVVAAGIAAFDPFREALEEGVELPTDTVAEAISILRLKWGLGLCGGEREGAAAHAGGAEHRGGAAEYPAQARCHRGA